MIYIYIYVLNSFLSLFISQFMTRATMIGSRSEAGVQIYYDISNMCPMDRYGFGKTFIVRPNVKTYLLV